MTRLWPGAVALGAAAAAVALLRHRGLVRGHDAPGGVLIGHVGAYDVHTRWLLGSLFDSIAPDVASTATPGAAVLEVGCGPGHLSLRLAREHGLEVTGLDLDPAMIERARANAERAWRGAERSPGFVLGDVASLPFADDSFDRRRQHVVAASLGRPDEGANRDWSCPAARWPSDHLGLPAGLAAAPSAHARSGAPRSGLRTQRGE
jgi:hypothetical protein